MQQTEIHRKSNYRLLKDDIYALISGEKDVIAAMANYAALIKEKTGLLWVGFYRVVDDHLVVGPFQGPIACSRIAKGKGVCGKSWADKKSIIVPDVELFSGHIACNPLSKSELAIPFMDPKGQVRFVLDLDSEHMNVFKEDDLSFFEESLQAFAHFYDD